jgi:ergothioneine biosynthesis protein EgtB
MHPHGMSANQSSAAEMPIAARDLAEAFTAVRGASLALTAPLEPEDCVVQTIPEVSPTKWHLAHVTWFFERFCLLESDGNYDVFNEHFLTLFNSYYYSVGQMHPRAERGMLNRPLFRDVLSYRAWVDEAMLELIEKRSGDAEFEFLVTLGINHEQQHQELLLTDIKHVFFTNPLQPVYLAPVPTVEKSPLPLRFVAQAGGQFAIGHQGDGFCFDNETPRHEVLVRDYRLANRLVTNGEYREFIRDGSYRQSQLWLSDAWSLIGQRGWDRPLYWSEDLEREFTLRGWQAIDPAGPVCHLSFYEADAFARWASARLPTEAEWELAARDRPVVGNTLDSGLLHPESALDRTDDQLTQIWGEVWEWTASPYSAYPGFRPLAGSLGEYNGKFMANQMVVRGGSCASWASHLRSSYRSFFYPQDRWQFLGLRLAQDG